MNLIPNLAVNSAGGYYYCGYTQLDLLLDGARQDRFVNWTWQSLEKYSYDFLHIVRERSYITNSWLASYTQN